MENLEKCKHNPWDNYGLCVLHNRWGYIKYSNPKIYRIYNEKGEWVKEVGEYYKDEMGAARRKGLKVELQDNSKLIKELGKSIKNVEQRIEEHKRNCKDFVFKRMEDGTIGYFKNS